MPVTPDSSIGTPAVSSSPYFTEYIPVCGFTSEPLIRALYAQLGLSNILDDTDSDIPITNGLTEYELVINSFIRDAEQMIKIRLGGYFEDNDMVGNSWVESKATWIAAYSISTRRGNEHYFQFGYDAAIREIDAVATGELPPPVDIPLRSHTYPAMSNYAVDERFAVGKMRVRQEISVGGPYPGQPIAIGYFWGWV